MKSKEGPDSILSLSIDNEVKRKIRLHNPTILSVYQSLKMWFSVIQPTSPQPQESRESCNLPKRSLRPMRIKNSPSLQGATP